MNRIAECELLKTKLLAELSDLKIEYELVKAAKEKPMKMKKGKELAEALKAREGTSNSSFAANSVDSNLYQRLKLNLLSSLTGVNVIHVTVEALPIEDNMPWFQYDVIANIEKLRFILTIVSNQAIDYQYSEKYGKPYELKTLSIRMMNLTHQIELAAMVDFYGANPNYIGGAVLNLRKYYNLNLHRSNVIKKLMEKYKDYLDVTLDNSTGFYTLVYKGSVSKRYFFTVIWSINWIISAMGLQDSYSCEIVESDAQFANDTDPILTILVDGNRSQHYTEEKKFDLFERVMIAVKDADTRLDTSSTSSMSG